MSSKTFKTDISKITEQVADRLDEFLLEFSQDIAEHVVKISPVDTGFFRASWTAALNNIDTTTTSDQPREDRTPGGEEKNGSQAQTEALNRITLNILGVEGGDTVYLSNNVDYGEQIEARTGIVKDTVSNATKFAEDAANRVKV